MAGWKSCKGSASKTKGPTEKPSPKFCPEHRMIDSSPCPEAVRCLQCPSAATRGEWAGDWIHFQCFPFQQFKLTLFPFLLWIFQPFLKSCRVWTFSWLSCTSECSNSDNFLLPPTANKQQNLGVGVRGTAAGALTQAWALRIDQPSPPDQPPSPEPHPIACGSERLFTPCIYLLACN